MIPGPTYVYACPDCQYRVTKRSLASGNTFGATHYSDMRVDAPMMPSYPRITKCVSCDCSFWLDETTQVEGAIMPRIAHFYDDDFTPSEVKNPAFGDQLELDPAKELDREDIKDALFMNVQRNEDDEQYLRYRLMWAYHKQLEDGTLTREVLNEDLDYLENIDAILNLIKEDKNGHLFRAELNRFAGRFDRSLELLEPTHNDPLWGVISKKMKELSEAGNREVFVLDVP
jgi:hypothetical protein